jgi:hypothetical protein
MLVDVAYSVKKHKGGHDYVPGFEMDFPMRIEDFPKRYLEVAEIDRIEQFPVGMFANRSCLQECVQL